MLLEKSARPFGWGIAAHAMGQYQGRLVFFPPANDRKMGGAVAVRVRIIRGMHGFPENIRQGTFRLFQQKTGLFDIIPESISA